MATKEQAKAYRKKYYMTHREQIREQAARYYQANKERMDQQVREWRKKHPERVRQHQKNYYKNNREKVLKRTAKYRAENPDKIREYHRNYYTNNREKIRNHNRFANGNEPITSELEALRNSICERDERLFGIFRKDAQPPALIYHEWVQNSLQYTGVALIDAAKYRENNEINIIAVLAGEINLEENDNY